MKMRGAGNRLTDDRGSAVLVALILIFAIGILTSALYSRLINRTLVIRRRHCSLIAFNLAEAGIETGLARLAADPGTLKFEDETTLGEDTFSVRCTPAGAGCVLTATGVSGRGNKQVKRAVSVNVRFESVPVTEGGTRTQRPVVDSWCELPPGKG